MAAKSAPPAGQGAPHPCLPQGTALVPGDSFSHVIDHAVVVCKCGRELYRRTVCGACGEIAVTPKPLPPPPPDQAERYARLLREGNETTPGIMAREGPDGRELTPFPHQRRFVKMLMGQLGRCSWIALLHEAGLGKSATTIQAFCALWLKHGGDVSMVVSVPSATLPQWEETAHTWTTLPASAILATNKTEALPATAEEMAKLRVLIVSHHTVQRLYKALVPGSKTPPSAGTVARAKLLFEKRWELYAADEGALAYPPYPHTHTGGGLASPCIRPHIAHREKDVARRQRGSKLGVLGGVLGEHVREVEALAHVALVVLDARDDVADLPRSW
ncbi:MAG: hypothetical protein CMI16_12785 [Opitutaceae bacterium]|nr:hypothetical protein [Opitutaceae bacterium]